MNRTALFGVLAGLAAALLAWSLLSGPPPEEPRLAPSPAAQAPVREAPGPTGTVPDGASPGSDGGDREFGEVAPIDGFEDLPDAHRPQAVLERVDQLEVWIEDHLEGEHGIVVGKADCSAPPCSVPITFGSMRATIAIDADEFGPDSPNYPGLVGEQAQNLFPDSMAVTLSRPPPEGGGPLVIDLFWIPKDRPELLSELEAEVFARQRR